MLIYFSSYYYIRENAYQFAFKNFNFELKKNGKKFYLEIWKNSNCLQQLNDDENNCTGPETLGNEENCEDK